MAKKKLKVLMASVEVAPLVKVGGLADVVGSLPPALKKLGVDIRLVMPLYGFIDKKKFKLKKIYSTIEIPSGESIKLINIWQSYLPKTRVPIYFIDAPEFKYTNSVYTGKDNAERFLFFSLAALYFTAIIDFIPDVVHCQDHHTALIPDIIKNNNFLFLKDVKTLYTIHNFNYQGMTEVEVLSTGNLTKNSLKTLTRDAADGDINYMVQGVLNSDLINTVSKTYAKEITTSFYGAKLDNIIRKRKNDLYGIINGLDINKFDPLKDKYISRNYTVETIHKKVLNKLALQKKLKLPIGKNIPLVGVVNRLYWQKGIDLITSNFGKLDCQFVFLGTGLAKYEKLLKALARKHPDKISTLIKFDLRLAQQIYAGSDIFLMPSRFEPCGLGQMIAMRYGTVPVVRQTGGLADTVDKNVGFSFKKISTRELYRVLKKALGVYYEKPIEWRRLQRNCMKKDFTWDKSAREYVRLYKKLAK